MLATQMMAVDFEALIEQGTKGLNVDTKSYLSKASRTIPETATYEQVSDTLIKLALENIDESSPDWTFVASRIYLDELYQKAAKNRGFDYKRKYGDFYDLISSLTEMKI